MKRTQIYLPDIQRKALRKIAQKRNTTVSDVIRGFIQDKLSKGNMFFKIHSHERLTDAAKRINKLGKGPDDLASNLDDYLYEGR